MYDKKIVSHAVKLYTHVFMSLPTLAFHCVLSNLLLYHSTFNILLFILLCLDIKKIYFFGVFTNNIPWIFLYVRPGTQAHTFLGCKVRSDCGVEDNHEVWIVWTLLDPM